MQVIKKMEFSEFEPWSGAIYTWEKVEQADKLDELEQLINDIVVKDLIPGATLTAIDETKLNDILWFERDFIFESLGINDCQDEVDEEGEDYCDENHASEWMEKHPYGWYNSENDKGIGDEEDE